MTIKQCRKLTGKTCDEFAKDLGISTKLYMYYESNQRLVPIDMAKKISKITGISYDVIFFD